MVKSAVQVHEIMKSVVQVHDLALHHLHGLPNESANAVRFHCCEHAWVVDVKLTHLLNIICMMTSSGCNAQSKIN